MEQKNLCNYVSFDKESHTYSICGVKAPSVSELMQHSGIIGDLSFLDPKYRTRGQIVHEMTELVDRGEYTDKSCRSDYKPFVEAYKNFLRNYHPTVLESEKMCFNSRFLYAGTYDRKYNFPLDIRNCLLDIKTSNNSNGHSESWHQVQLYLYKLFLDEDVILRNLYLYQDGSFYLEPHKEDPYIEDVALSCIYLWQFKNKKRTADLKNVVSCLMGE